MYMPGRRRPGGGWPGCAGVLELCRGYETGVLDYEPESALPVLYSILSRYADSTEPGDRRIAEAARGLIAELEQERDEKDA